MKKIVSFIALFFAILSISAQEVAFRLNAPSEMIVGQQYRIGYSVNGEGRDLRVPDFSGFDVLMGPSTSTSSSVQIVNGSMSSEVTTSFYYVVMPQKEGKYTLPAGTVSVKGKRITSNAVSVNVLPPDRESNTSTSSSSSSRSTGAASAQTQSGPASGDLYLRAQVSKTKAYQQEAILITYKLYSRLDCSVDNMKFPNFDGFHVQEIELPQDRQWSIENVNGTNFRTVPLRQYLLFPQGSGKLEIEPTKIECTVRMRTQGRSRSFFDDFFDSYQDVKRNLSSGSVSITSEALPGNKPASYSGGVGNFKITSSISKTKVKANEAVTITVNISGNGNLKLLKEPVIKFPEDFELYDPKITNNIKASAAGVSGSKQIEYLAIPRFQGKFTIPATEFSYFDTQTKQYKTVALAAYELEVEGEAAGNSAVVQNFSNKEDVRLLGQDIRYIRVGDLSLRPISLPWFGSTGFWTALLLPFVLFLILLLIYKNRIAESQNIALMKTKKANKVATKRLKTATAHLKSGNRELFFEEISKAIWGYLSDKLGIPLSLLSRDSIQVQLEQVGADAESITSVMRILDVCEYARYAPSQVADSLDVIYKESEQIISKMENQLSKKGRSSSAVKTIITLLMATATFSAMAAGSVQSSAEAAYKAQDYKKAIELYEQIAGEGKESAALYYNLGNAYYKNKQIGKSIQNYERSLLLDPANEDTRTNLEIAKLKTVDKIVDRETFLLILGVEAVQQILSANGWAILTVLSSIAMLLLLSLYFFSRTVLLKKMGFYSALSFLLLAGVSFYFASSSSDRIVHRATAVVGVHTSTIRSTPDKSGTSLFILHEGTKVKTSSEVGEWTEIQTADGNKGWIVRNDLLPI